MSAMSAAGAGWSRAKFVDWLGIAGGQALARRRLRHRRADPDDPRSRRAGESRRRRSVGRASSPMPARTSPMRAPNSGRAAARRCRSATASSTPSCPASSSTSCPTRRRRSASSAAPLGPGATVAAYVWDYAEGMELMRHFWDAAVALDPGGRKTRRGNALSRLPAGAAEIAFRVGGPPRRRRRRNRRADRVQGFRRLLVAVPWRPGSGADLLHGAARGGAERASRPNPRRPPRRARRQHPAHRPRLGRQGTEVGRSVRFGGDATSTADAPLPTASISANMPGDQWGQQ